MKISQNTPKMLKTKQTSFMNIYQIIIHTAGKQSPVLKRCFLLFILAAILQGAAIGMFVPFFISLGQEDYYHGLIWLSIMTLLSIFSLFSRWFGQDYDYKGYAAIAGNELRHKLGEHLRKIPLQTLHQRRTGEINAALAGNIDEVLNHTLMVSMMLINAVIIPFTVAVITLFFDWRMGFILLFIFPMIIPIYYCSRSLLERHKNSYVAAHAKLNAEVIEYVQGLPVLKASHCIGSKNDKIQSAAKHVEEVQRIALQKEMPANLLLGSAVELGLLLVIVLGVIWVVSGSLSIMLLSALIVAIIRFAEPLTSFLAVIAMYEIIKASFQRLQELQQIKPLPDTISSLLPKEYTIDFKSISFFYDNAKEASLKNISLTISQRSLTALVGSSGCGKTTLTRMIMRYADPQAGSLMIGGIDIRQISQEQLMSLISVVFQDVYLFDDSIFNNIRMGRSTATEDEVYAAAQQALCHDFIERLPQGYQTRVGDIGGRLSGGEKQRISIARALLKDAPIVILDEPTASLDTESEIAVQRAINTLVKNKTVIVIAHRLSTIMGAHNIVVLDKGKIIEQGKHNDLLKNQGRYAVLWHAQQYADVWLDDKN